MRMQMRTANRGSRDGGLVNPPRRLRGAFGICSLREGFVNLREGFVDMPWRLREAF